MGLGLCVGLSVGLVLGPCCGSGWVVVWLEAVVGRGKELKDSVY